MAASRWSDSIKHDLNVLLLKQRISPISRCINQRLRVTPLTREDARRTTRRMVIGRLRTSVLPTTTKERTLNVHHLSPFNIVASQHLCWRHKAGLVHEELDGNIVADRCSRLFQLELFPTRDQFSYAVVSRRTNALVSSLTPSGPPGGSIVTFAAEHKVEVKSGHPNHRPTPTQLSFVLLKLREELPHLFHPHYHLDVYIYSRDVRLENKLIAFLPFNIRGLTSYKLFMRCWQGLLRYSHGFPEFQLMKITKEEEKGEIHARWRICGLSRFAYRNKGTPEVIVEGFSEFAVNSSGLVHLHRMTKVMPVSKAVRRGPASWLAQLASLFGLTRQKSLAPECTT